VGRDLPAYTILSAVSVSIHAPAWGATRHRRKSDTRRCFNPRARVGRDMT